MAILKTYYAFFRFINGYHSEIHIEYKFTISLRGIQINCIWKTMAELCPWDVTIWKIQLLSQEMVANYTCLKYISTVCMST